MNRKTTSFVITIYILLLSLLSCKSYPAAFKVAKFINQSNGEITYIEGDSFFVVKPQESTDMPGIIFYPGGLVEYQSYLPLMDKLARKVSFRPLEGRSARRDRKRLRCRALVAQFPDIGLYALPVTLLKPRSEARDYPLTLSKE